MPASNFISALLLILLLLGVELFNDIVVKKWTLGMSSLTSLLIALSIHIFSFGLWILAMKYESFSKVIFLYAIFSVIGGALLGWAIFGEKLNSTGWVGISLGIVAIVLVNLNK